MQVTSILCTKCSCGIHSQFSSSDWVFFFTVIFHYTFGPIVFPEISISVHSSRIICTCSTVQLNAIRSTLTQTGVPKLLQYGHTSPFAWPELFQKSTPLQRLSEFFWKTVHVLTNIGLLITQQSGNTCIFSSLPKANSKSHGLEKQGPGRCTGQSTSLRLRPDTNHKIKLFSWRRVEV